MFSALHLQNYCILSCFLCLRQAPKLGLSWPGPQNRQRSFKLTSKSAALLLAAPRRVKSLSPKFLLRKPPKNLEAKASTGSLPAPFPKPPNYLDETTIFHENTRFTITPEGWLRPQAGLLELSSLPCCLASCPLPLPLPLCP